MAVIGAGCDDPVSACLLVRHIHHSNHVAGLVGVDHFLHAAGPEDQVVGKENGNRLGTDKMARAPDRMAEPCRLLLADIEDRIRVCAACP